MMRYFSLVFILILTGCGTNPDKPYSDTPTSGKVNIAVDETMIPLAGAQLDTFHSLYRYAKISTRFLPEDDLFRLLLDDSVKVIMSARELNQKEKDYFAGRHLVPVTTKVAYDAVAVILHKSNPDTLINIPQLRKILNGEAGKWKDLFAGSAQGNIKFVFDQSGSSVFRLLKDTLKLSGSLPEWCFAAKSNKEVIEYVEKTPGAIGVIGISWISDHDDSAVMGFLDKITVASLAADSTASPENYNKPYQGYLYEKSYPLIREIYMISREGRAGLGTGFVSFVAGDQGQRLVRLNGLLPATMPVRVIQNR